MTKAISVLVAEDSKSIALFVKEIIIQNFECNNVEIANDGMEAWDKIINGHFDLIISDWNMPKKTGDELLREIREIRKTKNIPFIMLTARAYKESVMTAIKSGVNDYILKPIDEDTLVKGIQRLLTLKSQ